MPGKSKFSFFEIEKVMFWIILNFIIYLLVLRLIILVAIYGRNLLHPDFKRVDEMFLKRHDQLTNWTSLSWKMAYYFLWLWIIAWALLIIHVL